MIINSDSLEYITSVLCKTAKHVDIINQVFKAALFEYQWKYQNAEDRDIRDIKNGADIHIREAAKVMRAIGNDYVADEMESSYKHYVLATKKGVSTEAAQYMKEELLSVGMTERKHKDEYSKFLKLAFIEWCEQNPLEENPINHNSDYDPEPYV